MAYSELFDGEEHWLAEGCAPGWVNPFLVPGPPVELEVQTPALTELESPELNFAPVENPVLSAAWAVEGGWSGLAVSLQRIGELLSLGSDNLLLAEQLVARDEVTWKITSTHYRVLWKGDPETVEGI